MIPGRTFYLEQLLIYHSVRGLWIAGDERTYSACPQSLIRNTWSQMGFGIQTFFGL